MNHYKSLRKPAVATALLAIAIVNGSAGLGFSQTSGDSATVQSKQNENSQDGLFDYETTQSQDKQLQAQSELEIGDHAPDIQLTQLTDFALGSPIQLSSLHQKKPLVVFMGSCTCGLTNSNVPQMEKLYKAFQDRANFAFIYMKDAHPAPAKSVEIGGKQVRLAQPKTMGHRINLAKHLLRKTGLTLPIYIDDMKGTGRKAFSGFHLSAYVIDTDAKLAFVRRYKYDVADVKSALTTVLE